VSDLEQLLEVQGHDTRADQIRHQRATLPERAALAAAEADLARIVAAWAPADARRQELASEQRRLEDDVASTRARIANADTALYSGSTSNPRELQALQDEIASLTRRVSLLEDEELAVMEQLEPVEGDLSAKARERDRLEGEIERLRAAVTAGEAELDVALDAEAEQRRVAAEVVPDGLLTEYERIRARSAGVGVARLVAGQCGGCHLRLSAVELDRIKKQPVDTVVHCDECGRLLVR